MKRNRRNIRYFLFIKPLLPRNMNSSIILATQIVSKICWINLDVIFNPKPGLSASSPCPSWISVSPFDNFDGRSH